MKKVIFILVALGLLVIIALPGCQPAAPETFEWRLQVAAYPGSMEGRAMPGWVDWVEQESEGRLKITWLYSPEIVPEDEIISATGKGIMEMGSEFPAYSAGVWPALEVAGGIPGTWGTPAEITKMHNEGLLREQWDAIAAEAGIKFLWSTWIGSYPLLASTVPIRTIDDFAGLKMRTFGLYSDTVEALGAAPTYFPGGETYMALKLGTVDAVTYSVEGIDGFKWYEVMEYWILPFMSDTTMIWFFVNPDAFDSLPADLQDVLLRSEDICHQEFKKIVDDVMAANYQYAEDGWYEIINLPDEDIARMGEIIQSEVWPNYAAINERTAAQIEFMEAYYGY